MRYRFKTTGVCSRSITLDLEGGIVKDVKIEGGCDGNSQGIAALVRGMPAQEVARRLKDIKCETKSTSCPDQLAIAIEEALNKTGGVSTRPKRS
ncbi:MAG: TIGR03905 family TSCPD domain-containing protein [Clostridia bacterium]|nr:TIGR03905 family TSCPD domain-containing protein [Clostridia bacterium]